LTAKNLDKQSTGTSHALGAKITILAPKRGSRPVLRDSEVYLGGGKITCLLGPSGAGKTTLLRLLGGDQAVEFSGSATYYYLASPGDVKDAARNGRIGLFLPDGALPPWQTVQRILCLPARLNTNLKAPVKNEIESVLTRLRLPIETLLKVPSELSLGMRHRVLLALAFLYKPVYYLIDELFSALDQPTAELVLNELRRQVKESNSTCLVATHDLDRALAIGDAFYYKDLGQNLLLVEHPTRSELIELFEEDYAKSLMGGDQ
jgi:ABC-type multidrug transport system ATPase subunit